MLYVFQNYTKKCHKPIYILEIGCGPSISPTARRLPDIACESMGCLGSNNQACGGEFIMALYQFNAVPLEGCSDTTFFTPFQLNAVFMDEPTTSVPITMTSLIVHNNPWGSGTDAGILSVCPFQFRPFVLGNLTSLFSS